MPPDRYVRQNVGDPLCARSPEGKSNRHPSPSKRAGHVERIPNQACCTKQRCATRQRLGTRPPKTRPQRRSPESAEHKRPHRPNSGPNHAGSEPEPGGLEIPKSGWAGQRACEYARGNKSPELFRCDSNTLIESDSRGRARYNPRPPLPGAPPHAPTPPTRRIQSGPPSGKPEKRAHSASSPQTEQAASPF